MGKDLSVPPAGLGSSSAVSYSLFTIHHSLFTVLFEFRPHLGQFLLILPFLQISTPHDDGVLAVVAVVPFPDADLSEAVFLVQRLRRGVRLAHFQSHPACAAYKGGVDQPHLQPY